MVAAANLPPNLEKKQNYLTCGLEGPRDVETYNYSGSFSSLSVSDEFSLRKFKKQLRIEVKELKEDHVIFELINPDVSIANAIRRILIAEVPTMAIETVHLWQNTGVIQDEVLAHRLGLIPIKVDPELFDYRKDGEEFTEKNALKFRFHVKCSEKDIQPPLNSKPIYAKDLQFVPLNSKQEQQFKACPPAPVEPNILITKLRPGQEIETDLYCEKGIGKTHAKWSPVATAVYRLLPCIEFPNGPLTGNEAEELKSLCPMGVFDVEDGASVASKPRQCTTCRACLERFPKDVALLKNKHHFIFTIESTGAVPATVLFLRAVDILRKKAINIKDNLLTALAKTNV